MATIAITKGYNDPSGFTSGEVITPAKLNSAQSPTAAITFNTAADTDDSTLEVSGGKFRLKDGGVTLAKLVAAVQSALLPTGAVSYFARDSAPTGWVLANGNTIGSASSNATRANADTEALFTLLWANGWTNAILPVLTSGGAASTRGASAAADWSANKRMTLPDLRGVFIRGWGSQTISTVSYSSGAFGASQQDTLQGHIHNVFPSTVVISSGGSAYFGSGTASNAATTTGGPVTDGTNGTPRVATETRPVNIGLSACIKL